MSLARARKTEPAAARHRCACQTRRWRLCARRSEIAGAGFSEFPPEDFRAGPGVGSRRPRRTFVFRESVPQPPRTVVIDFSSPNVAKPMHVGHIRSTILGDCLARTLRLLGHRVITDNHIGDWGTQFGMLLSGGRSISVPTPSRPIPSAKWSGSTNWSAPPANPSARPSWKPPARNWSNSKRVTRKIRGIWREMIALSKSSLRPSMPGWASSSITPTARAFTIRASSRWWRNCWPRALRGKAKARMRFSSTDAAPDPRKEQPRTHSQERRRVQLRDDRFGDAGIPAGNLAPARNHLRHRRPAATAFPADVRRFPPLAARTRDPRLKLAHVWFGSILGEDGKPFKTRCGETVKLAELLDEAEERAFKIVSEKNPDLPEAQRREIARVVGLGAVKYADLLPNRQSDYVFSWDKMLALQGNTAPYLQYAYARIQSIFRKAGRASNSRNRGRTSNWRTGGNRSCQTSVEFRAHARGGGGGVSAEFPVQLPV